MPDKHPLTYWMRFFVLIFLFCVIPSHAQNITIRDIPSQDKLPVNAIHRIFQDSDGYMWYGTFNGLCRYDGYNIRVFRSDLLHPGMLSNNYITYIAEDHEKKIWFGTREGVYTLDKTTYRITHMDMGEHSDKDVFSINVTRDGTIWVSVLGTLVRLGPDGKVIQTYKIEYNGSPRQAYIVYENKADELLASLNGGGMYRLNEEKDAFEPYHHHPDYMDIEKIIWDEAHGCYWLGTWGKGIVRFDPQQQEHKLQYVPQPLPRDILGKPVGNLFHMVQDDTFHYLWVTSERDLFAFRVNSQGTLEQVDTSSFLSTGNKMLYEIYKDKYDKLWVSSFDMPSFIVDIREYTVKDYPLQPLRNQLKANPAILSLCVDEKGVFWFTQERYGLYAYDSQTEILKHYSGSRETQHLPFWEVPQIVHSRTRNSVWAVPYSSTIYELKWQDGEMKQGIQVCLTDVTDHSGSYTFLFEDKNGDLWIGTTTSLFIYRGRTGQLERISEDVGHISQITETEDGYIWIALKNKGIGRIDKDKQITIYPFDKDFLCMDATSDGKLWLGTGAGELLLYDPVKNELTDQSSACGMKGDIINSITVDVYNHVWIGTNQIIKEYNPRNGAYRSYNTRNKNFLLDRLLSRAVYYDGKGEIYYGGISGIVSIPPSQQLESIPEHVITHITDIKILGESIWEDYLTANPLRNSLSVSPTDQNLEIEFSSLDFHHLDQIRYAYRMLGVDKDWIYLDEGRNSAFYNKLDKGKYTFEVKATDKNGLWSNEVTTIDIHRLPAFYETWWAYTLYIVLILGICWTMLYLYLRRVKQENDKKVAEQVTQMKLRYFTNISHDLMTPLTIFSCVVDEMQTTGREEESHINLLRANITRLKRLIQQVLDFRKVESGNMKLNVSHGNITGFVENICQAGFGPLVRSKQIQFTLRMQPLQIDGYFDFDKLDKILFNLLSNAFKYTPSGRAIHVEISTSGRDGHIFLELKVEDEGKGIDQKEQKKIFTRFYNNKLSEAGTSNGIGLSLVKELVELHHGSITLESELRKGSVFTVIIPIDKESYGFDELADRPIEQTIGLDVMSVREMTANTEPAHTYNLLLVEDSEELLSLMRNLFIKDYHVFTAQNGVEALEQVGKHAIDIIVSDVMMPEMDGLELCRTIKEDINTSHIIVILLTAKIATEDRIESYQVGADDYIPKPFEVNVLRARLENLLRLRKQKQEDFKKNSKLEISQLAFSSLDEQLITKALQTVEANLSDQNFDVAKLAGLLHLSRATLTRKFRAMTGQSPLEFIRDIKMKHACRMLENPNMTIQEVIVAIGYNDHKHFTANFKETFGITSSEYQKQRK